MTDTTPSAVGDLTLVSTPELVAPGRFVLQVQDGWQQGRGAFGGLVLAALARATIAAEPEKDRTLRSLNAEIAGPVLPGEALIEVKEIRRGSGLSSYTAMLSQQGQPLVHASAVLARARGVEAPKVHIAPPDLGPWADVEPIPVDVGLPVPVFVRHLEMRPLGPLPFSGVASEPVASGWVRARRPLAALGAPELIALADAWWPAGLAATAMPRPLATVAFALQCLLPEPPLDPAVPLFYRGRVVAELGGYMTEFRELWSADGRLVALNQQTIAWIR